MLTKGLFTLLTQLPTVVTSSLSSPSVVLGDRCEDSKQVALQTRRRRAVWWEKLSQG